MILGNPQILKNTLPGQVATDGELSLFPLFGPSTQIDESTWLNAFRQLISTTDTIIYCFQTGKR